MKKKQKTNSNEKSKLSSGILVLENGQIFRGIGLGHEGEATGEVCFNTSITGYQEIISDPSYSEQIINHSFKLFKDKRFANSKIIDLRIKNKVINYE